MNWVLVGLLFTIATVVAGGVVGLFGLGRFVRVWVRRLRSLEDSPTRVDRREFVPKVGEVASTYAIVACGVLLAMTGWYHHVSVQVYGAKASILASIGGGVAFGLLLTLLGLPVLALFVGFPYFVMATYEEIWRPKK